MSTRDAILEFRRDYAERFGTENPSTASDVGQILGLQEARLLAVALLLEVAPEVLLPVLDRLVWDSDLSDQALSTAWSDLHPQKAAWPKGYWESFGPVCDDFAAPPDTITLGPEAMAAFIATLMAPPPLNDALRRAFGRWALLSRLAKGEMEFEAGEVQPASEVFRAIRLRSRAPTESEEIEVMKEASEEVREVRRHRQNRTPEEQAEFDAAIKKVVESFPPRSDDDFDSLVKALLEKWKR